MAENSVFGDDSLFQEFERESEPTDTILKQTILKSSNISAADEDLSAQPLDFIECSDTESESSSTSKDDDFIENEDSDHGGGITGVADTLHSITGKSTLSEAQQTQFEVKNREALIELKEKVEELAKENKILRRQLKMINTDKIFDVQGPAVQVIYMNHNLSRKYKSEIEDFILKKLTNGREENLHCLHLRPNSVCLSSKNGPKLPTPKEKMNEMKAHMAISCGQYYKDFIYDAMGWPLVEYNPALTDGWEIPVYQQFYSSSLPVDGEEEAEKQSKPKRAKASCFNCGGEHNLKECKQRLDQRIINKNRSDFMATNSPSRPAVKMQRYIPKDKTGVRESFKPGQISDNLREALGLRENQMAPFIYNMRLLGYPPGWLEEAAVYTSGMAIFDKHGNGVTRFDGYEVANENVACEDGEIELNGPEQKKYDFEMFVEYPGFNVDIEEGMVDESRHYRVPPMQDCQSKEALKQYLEPALRSTPNTNRKRKSDVQEYPGSGKKLKADNGADAMDLTESDGEVDGKEGAKNSEENEKSPELVVIDSIGETEEEDGEILDEDFVPPVPPTPEPPPLPPGTPPVTPQSGAATPTSAKSAPKLAEPFKTPLPLSSPSFSKSLSASGSNKTSTPSENNRSTLSNRDSKNGDDRLASRIDFSKTSDVDGDGCIEISSDSNEENSPSSPSINIQRQDTAPIDSSNLTSSATPERSSKVLHVTSSAASFGSPLNSSSSSISSSYGTPVLERSLSAGSVTSAKGLPDAKSFALGITEHLPFENLPKATGKYQQMKKVLDMNRKDKK